MTPDRAAVSMRTAADMYDISEDLLRAAIDRRELVARKMPSVKAGKRGGPTGTAIRIGVAELDKWFNGLPDARDEP